MDQKDSLRTIFRSAHLTGSCSLRTKPLVELSVEAPLSADPTTASEFESIVFVIFVTSSLIAFNAQGG
jgi:hypothetical protein